MAESVAENFPKPIIYKQIISGADLGILQQASEGHNGLVVSVLAPAGENYTYKPPESEEYTGPVPARHLYVQITSPRPDLSGFWDDVKKLRQEPVDPKK